MFGYISGPMTGYDNMNHNAFDEAARVLRSKGWIILSPAEHDREANVDMLNLSDTDLFNLMRWDIAAVLQSDAVILLPNWRNSKGANIEVSVARSIGLSIYLYPDMTILGDTSETRIINPLTGGAKGQKLARFDLIPGDSLWALAEHFGKGSAKYQDRNWELGTNWSLNFSAAQRHMWQWWEGENTDEETESSHLIAACWHMMALFHLSITHPELDDRPK